MLHFNFINQVRLRISAAAQKPSVLCAFESFGGKNAVVCVLQHEKNNFQEPQQVISNEESVGDCSHYGPAYKELLKVQQQRIQQLFTRRAKQEIYFVV